MFQGFTAPSLPQLPQQQQHQQYPKRQQYNHRFNSSGNKRPNTNTKTNQSQQQQQQELKSKNDITIKINRLTELLIHGLPTVYPSQSINNRTTTNNASSVFNTPRTSESINADLPVITRKKQILKPIRTRQLLGSTYTQSMNLMATTNNVLKNSAPTTTTTTTMTEERGTDPIMQIIGDNQKKYTDLRFNSQVIKVNENKVELFSTTNSSRNDSMVIPTSAKKRTIQEIDTNLVHNVAQKNKKRHHKYDLPLDNSRTISAKEVLRMVDSSLISSDMDFSNGNSTTTMSNSFLANNTFDGNTPLKRNPSSYLRIFGGGAATTTTTVETPLRNQFLSSTPQSNGAKILDIMEDSPVIAAQKTNPNRTSSAQRQIMTTTTTGTTTSNSIASKLNNV